MRMILPMNAMALIFWLIIYQPVSADESEEIFMIGSENFDGIKDGEIPKDWWIEGGQKVGVENGHLRIIADPFIGSGKWCTVWTDIVVSGNAQISYDAHVLSSRNNGNNINFFLYYSDPSGKDLHATRAKRKDANYSLYHDMDGYIITFLNKEEHARIRIRRCPGFKLLKEDYGYHCNQGKTYHLKITKQGGLVTLDIDNGNYSLIAEDQKPLVRGRIGFRTYKTDYWVDNLKVVSISAKKQ